MLQFIVGLLLVVIIVVIAVLYHRAKVAQQEILNRYMNQRATLRPQPQAYIDFGSMPIIDER